MRAAIILLSVAVLAGCGGSSARSLGSVTDCLHGSAAGAGLTVSTDPGNMDAISEYAGQGAVVLLGGGQDIQVVVERSSADAQATEREYQAFSGVFGGSIQRFGNVVVAFSKTPSGTEQHAVGGCV